MKKAINIKWDVDYDELGKFLPTEMEIPVGMTDEDMITQYLSHVTGVGHQGYDLIEVPVELNKTDILKAILSIAQEELNENGSIGYTMPDGKYHIFISVDDIGDYLNGSELVYRIEPNILDKNGCAEPMGDCTMAPYSDFAQLLIGCMWCMDQFEADLEHQKGIETIPHIEIDLGNRTLVAETGYEKDYKEIYVGLKEKDGTWVQDLAVIGAKYHYDNELHVIQDEGISVKVYADKDNEDYTHDFSVDIWAPQEESEHSKDIGIDIVKLQEYLKEEMIIEFNSEKECMDYFNLYDGQNFKSVEEMKEYQGVYGFGLDGKWYHISFDEALDVLTDRLPDQEQKTSLDSKIKNATSRATNDATNTRHEKEEERE